MTPAAVIGKGSTRGGRQPVRKCGRPKRQGSREPCRRGAGWGTSHDGYGACKLHGGCTPSGIKAAAKEAARDFAVGMLGAEVDVDPLGAMLLSVKLAAGMVAYYRLQMVADGDAVSPALVDGYERANERMGKLAKAALDAGVNERLVKIAERTAERIALAAEEALEAAGIKGEQRKVFAMGFGRSLARLEEAPFEGEVLEA